MIRPPAPSPSFTRLFQEADRSGRLETIIRMALDPTPGGRYHPWDSLRRRTPPEGMSTEEWWLSVKIARQPLLRTIPLYDLHGRPLKYAMPDPVTEYLQLIDRDASGQILLSEEALSPGHRDRYIVSSLMEEAAMSSLLEGAATTRREAREMLRTARPATTQGERMVRNNFRAMQRVKELVSEELSPDLIHELHSILAQDTMERGKSGVYRGPDSEDRFGVWSGDQRLYRPPPHDAIPEMIEQVCRFTNEDEGPFIHPVIKAIALHFWIGFVHPYEDGNGRTARALFYWFLLRSRYWLFEYISISGVLKEAYAKYARAYLYTESDDLDLTYFLIFHLKVISRALNNVQGYINRKTREIRETRALLHPSSGLNHRQIALLRRALQHPDTVFTYGSHQMSHNVVYQTARTDLLDLHQRGLLIGDTKSRKHTFRPPADLAERVHDSA